MKKSIITILFLCCLMGTVTASAAQVKDAETVSPAVAAMAQVQAQDKAKKKDKTTENKNSDKIGDRLRDRVHALIPASAFSNIDNPGTITPDTVKYHYAESQHMATPVTAWNRQKYEDQYQYQYQHDSYDAAIADAYAYRRDFGKSNLRKWSSTEGMDTPWDSNWTTDTAHFQSSTIAFLDRLNTEARQAGISFVITGGAESGYHASGIYSHENGYKVDISDDGIYQAPKPTKSSSTPCRRINTRLPTNGTRTTTTSQSIRKIIKGKKQLQTQKGLSYDDKSFFAPERSYYEAKGLGWLFCLPYWRQRDLRARPGRPGLCRRL